MRHCIDDVDEYHGSSRHPFLPKMHLLPFADLLLALCLGAALGFVGGLFGIGGGIVAIPLFVLAFAMDQATAQGTALVLMVPNLLIGWWRYSQKHPVGWRAALAIAAPATLTTWALARFATALDGQLLGHLFSAFLGILALRLLWQGRGGRQPATGVPLRPAALPLVGVAGGSSMGLLGIGGGLVATPLLAGWLGQRQTVAQSLALALVTPSSLVALGAYAGAQRVDWSLGLPMALGGTLTVAAGVALAHKLPERRMRAAFAWMLLATALWLALAPR
jgi:uncharacterized membrane protein YfcA